MDQLIELIPTVSTDKQQQLNLILEQLKNDQATLTDLQTNLKMVQDMEEN